MSKREPRRFLMKLVTRMKFTFQVLTRIDLRTILACETLVYCYRHSTRKIVLGESMKVPWYTYSFIEHLISCDLSQLIVFEFGGGNSTKFWVEKSLKVVTVERDMEWFEFIKQNCSSEKLTLLLCESREKYINSILEVSHNKEKFDLIIIDGSWRKLCIETSLMCLKPNGCIVVDNSDWCPETCWLLESQGFARIDFSSFGASNQFTWTTSMFFKSLESALLHPIRSPKSLGYISPDQAQYMFRGENC